MLNKTDRSLVKAQIKPLLDQNLNLYRAAWHGDMNTETLREEYQEFCRKAEAKIASILEDFGLEDARVSLAGSSPTYYVKGMVNCVALSSLWGACHR